MNVVIKNYFKVGAILISMLSAQGVYAGRQMIDQVIAVVNHHVITQHELDYRMSVEGFISGDSELSGSHDTLYSKHVLQGMINAYLIKEQAREHKIAVSQLEIDRAVALIAKQNRLSVSDFKQRLVSSGLNDQQYRQLLSEQIMIHKVQIQLLGPQVTVNQEAIRSFKQRYIRMRQAELAEYHVWDFVVLTEAAPGSKSWQAARSEAKRVMYELHLGKTIKDMGAQAKAKEKDWPGGDLGWRHLHQLPAVFTKQVVNMKVNEIVGPVQTSNGFHVVQLLGKRVSPVHLTDEQAKRGAYEQAIVKRYQEWIKTLRKAAYIRYG